MKIKHIVIRRKIGENDEEILNYDIEVLKLGKMSHQSAI